MTKTVYIVDIEPVETRYTCEWQEFLPKQLSEFLGPDTNVIPISGEISSTTTSPGAFLDFSATNIYKSSQLIKIAELFAAQKINNGDYFLFTDAWNPTVIQLRYMAELNGVDINIGGMWHAGSYDPADFLGRIIGGKPWVRFAEASMFQCYTHNFFATTFHVNLFAQTFLTGDALKIAYANNQIKVVGWPMEYLETSALTDTDYSSKEDIVLFPHRVAPEKQPELFKQIAEKLPDVEFVMCQEQNLTKQEYHRLLKRAKVVFSANLQETLGISAYEALLAGTVPVVPDRLSYAEMYSDNIKYSSALSEPSTPDVDALAQLVEQTLSLYPDNAKEVVDTELATLKRFFNGGKLYETIQASIQ
jgi:hypothetical protein